MGYGDPDYESYLKHLVYENGLDQHVHFVGYVNGASQLIEEADVLLNCSVNKAFGRVTIEAMKAGTIVVGANSGGTAELVDNGSTGLLYEPHNPADLAEKLRQLISTPQLMATMATTGRTWATSRFTLERYAGEILALLEGVTIGREHQGRN